MSQGVEQLTERQALILQAVVHTYTVTAEPVGSRAIVRRYGLDLSPATVRIVMAELEEAGYLQQLHTSSGRVPTDKGYRYYVDYLMHVQQLSMPEQARLEHELSEELADADEVMRRTSHMLATISRQTGIVEAPGQEEARVRRIELIPVGHGRVAVMLADNYGRVRTVVVPLTQPISSERLQRVGWFLNDNVKGTAPHGLVDAVTALMESLFDEQRQLAEEALRVLSVVPPTRQGELFLDGATQLFEQPEFHDIQKARQVFGALEEREQLVELMRAMLRDRQPMNASVLIGSEMPGESLSEMSLIIAPYRVGDRSVGVLGVLGPRRMHYSRLTGLVDYTAALVSRYMTEISESADG